MLPGPKPDYNANNSAVNARFFELDERIAHSSAYFQLKIPFSRPPSCCCPCREKIVTFEKKLIFFAITRDAGSSGICMACSSLMVVSRE